MYRDFQENTINSDGSFGMWIAAVAFLYACHAIYSYFIPWYWNKTAPCKNGEDQRTRMRDIMNSAFFEDITGLQYLEWGFSPHAAHHIRTKLVEGHLHPDDARAMHVTGFNRTNRYKEHYMNRGPLHQHKRMLKEFWLFLRTIYGSL